MFISIRHCISFFLALNLVLLTPGMENIFADLSVPGNKTVLRTDKTTASGLKKLELPESMGTIVERFSGASPYSIVLIQDMHCAPEAQRIIAQIASYLQNRHGFDFLALEGASGPVDPSPLRVFPNKNVRDKVMDLLLEEGTLTGIEWASAREMLRAKLWGIDDPVLYQENLNAFARSKAFGKSGSHLISSLRDHLQALKQRVFLEELYRFDEAYWLYRENEKDLDELLSIIIQAIRRRSIKMPDSIQQYENFVALSAKVEPIRFQQQMNHVIEHLSRKKTREQMTSVLKSILAFRLGKKTEREFFSELSTWIEESQINWDEYPDLKIYIDSLDLLSEIDLQALDHDIDNIALKIFSKKYRTLFNQSQRLFLLSSLLRFRLTPQGWKELSEDSLSLKPWKWGESFSEELAHDGDKEDIQKLIQNAAVFYQTADKRNFSLTEMTLQKMKKLGKTSAIVVAGGFHRNGITGRLKKLGVSYCVIMPRIRKFNAMYYEDRLLARPTDLDLLIGLYPQAQSLSQTTQTDSFLAPALRTASKPLSYPILREVLLKKAYVLYSLVTLWETKGKGFSESLQKARAALMESLSPDERHVIEPFLESVSIGKIEGSGLDQVWIRGIFGQKQIVFVLGKNMSTDEFELTKRPSAQGTLDMAEGISFTAFSDKTDLVQTQRKTRWERLKQALRYIVTLGGLFGVWPKENVSVARSSHPSLTFSESMIEITEGQNKLKLDAAIEIEDMDRFLEDPERLARMTGTVSGGPFENPLILQEGSLNILRKNPDNGRRELIYKATFSDREKTYHLEGTKIVENDIGMDAAKDMTRLYARIWTGEAGKQTLVWRGDLRFPLLDLPSLLDSMQSGDASSISRFRTKLRFFRFVIGQLARVYFLPPPSLIGKEARPPKPDLNRVRLSSDRSLLENEAYDVIVIGSGYGGAVTALRLAEAGLKVAVMERGREVPVGDFPDTALGAIKEVRGLPDFHFHLPTKNHPHIVAGISHNRMGLFDFRLDTKHPKGVHVVVGQGLGGTSLINANVMEQPTAEVFRDPAWPPEIARELGPYYDLANQTLQVSKVTESKLLVPGELPRKTQALFAAAESDAGLRLAQIAVNFQEGRPIALPGLNTTQPPCTMCGDCVSGCNVGAKNTLMMNYLPGAVSAGARMFSQIEVDHLSKSPDGSYEIHYAYTEELDMRGDKAPRRVVRAPKVILAAGSLGSTEILLRSQKSNPSFAFSSFLGQRFTSNADVAGLGYNTNRATDIMGFGNRIDAKSQIIVGPTIAGVVEMSKSPENASYLEKFLIEEGAIPRALVNVMRYALAVGLLRGIKTEVDLKEKLRKIKRIAIDLLPGYASNGAINHSIVYLSIGHDSATGKMVLDKKGNIEIEWPGAASEEVFKRITDAHHRMTENLGGTPIKHPSGKVLTVHPLGGASMGLSAQDSVVNHRGQVFDPTKDEHGAVYTGLYVADGAIISKSLGVNPALTIAALSERIAAKIIENDISKPVTADPSELANLIVLSLMNETALSESQARKRWPLALESLVSLVTNWLAGNPGPEISFESMPPEAREEIMEIGKHLSSTSEQDPEAVVLDLLTVMLSPETTIVRPKPLTVRDSQTHYVDSAA